MKTPKQSAQESEQEKPGRRCVENGLWLLVKPSGRRYWQFRYRDRVTGRVRDKNIGPCGSISMAVARKKAAQYRSGLYDGIDPIDSARRARDDARKAEAARVTFAECANAYIDSRTSGWRSEKHRKQWVSTLNTYCKELLPMSAWDITSDDVQRVLNPIWETKTVTATRVRQRIEAIMDWAAVNKHRDKNEMNPARWHGYLQKAMTPPASLTEVKHHAALPYVQIGDFVAEMAMKDCISARAVTLQVLTATRSNETAAARWDEFDFETGIWTVPKSRTKSKRDHRIPLPVQAIAMLTALPRHPSGFVFSSNGSKPLSINAMLQFVKGMRPGITCHGFRSSFRDWAADTTDSGDVAEAALAHVTKDKTVAAYLRTTMFEKRKKLMADWAAFCFTPSPTAATVTNLADRIAERKAG